MAGQGLSPGTLICRGCLENKRAANMTRRQNSGESGVTEGMRRKGFNEESIAYWAKYC